MSGVNYQDVLSAAEVLRGVVRETPLIHSPSLDGWLKLENLQFTGAYKVRGAFHALWKQVRRGDHRPVVAASAGNHAAGLAWAAQRLGLPAIAVVPEDAPTNKTERTESFGGRVIRHGASFEDSTQEAMALAERHNWRFLHPFDDVDVIAGQGSIGVELLSFRPDLVLVPVGGGGLASGMGTLLRAYNIPVIGVQVEGVDGMNRTLRREANEFVPRDTIADGIRVQRVGTHTARICEEVLDDVVLVSEKEVRGTLRSLALTDHVIAEGAGAVAAAALHRFPGKKKVAVVSGGNVDGSILSQVLAQKEPFIRLEDPVFSQSNPGTNLS